MKSRSWVVIGAALGLWLPLLSWSKPLAGQSADGPTWARDVAPILYRECAPCHHPGGAGPFSLLAYEDARKRARQIAQVTGRRYMPPWLPDRQGPAFEDARLLSDAQLAAVLAGEGVKVARRTVAKYREALGLASSSERRQTAVRAQS